MRPIYQSIILLTLIIAFSCDSKTSESNPEVPQHIIDKTLEYFEGEVIEKDLENEEGIEAWTIVVEDNNESIVKFYWPVNGQNLLKMEGQKGPFDYDIWPGDDLINFSTARTVAIGALKNNNITKWELAQEDEFIDKWIYTFEFGSQKVYVDAENGDVLQIN